MSREIRLSNRLSAITLSEAGSTLAFQALSTGASLLSEPGLPFARLTMKDGSVRLCDGLSWDGSALTIRFGGDCLRLGVESHDDFFLLTVLSAPACEYRSFVFADFRLDYDFAAQDVPAVSAYSLSPQIESQFFPGGAAKAVLLRCFRAVDPVGAKAALITAPYARQREIIQEINGMIPRGTMPISLMGGAYAQDRPDNFKNYVIMYEISPEKVGQWIDFYRSLDVEQLDFHQGKKTFRQGDFHFHRTDGARGFRETVAEPLEKAGITCGLHSYSASVDYEAEGILKNPVWQRQLEVFRTYTLAEAVSPENTFLPTVENVEEVAPPVGFVDSHTRFLLIDEEIIRFGAAEDGFVRCDRGWAGTTPAPHAAGSEIRALCGMYGMLVPRCDSELFLHIAREIARTYNEGGFGMMYLDGLEGLTTSLRQRGEEELTGYYAQLFVSEVLKYCVRPPVVEYSMFPPSLWPGRGRAGATDTPGRAYKRFTDRHLAQNRAYMDIFMPSTLGWYEFAPDYEDYPGNFAAKYMFDDDMDYMGVQALAYNQSIAYNGLTQEMMETRPAVKRCVDRYLKYDALRRSRAVPEETLACLREGTHEWTLTETESGPVFHEAATLRARMNDARRDALISDNPFGTQTPFIRIENLLSSRGEDPFVLLPLDETRPLVGQPLSAGLAQLNMTDRLALRVRVLGNGSSGAVCIRLKGLHPWANGVYDWLIRTDFTGWRELILAEPETGEHPGLDFAEKNDGLYAIFRELVNYGALTEVSILTDGCLDGVQMSSVEAVRHEYRPLVNPTVTLNGQRMTFLCTLENTEYLEYTPGGAATIYDRRGFARPAGIPDGSLTVPSGPFAAALSDEGDSALPLRAILTLRTEKPAL